MRLVNWRELAPERFTSIWHTLTRRWAERLAWDSTSNWVTIEAQRRSGMLPGLALVDGDHIAAWCFFGVSRGTLQVGGFESDSVESTETLLDGVLSVASPEVAPAGVMFFTFSEAPALVDALQVRGFAVDRYRYLTREVVDGPVVVPDPGWERRFNLMMPSLLERSYGPPSLTRPFARQGLPEEWREYVGQLLGVEACGRFDPRLSAARLSTADELDGAVITTIIGPGSAHIAQVVVAPESRGRGLSSAMVMEVLARVRRDGFGTISLLVSEHNRTASTIYQSLGFRGTEVFLSAGLAAGTCARRSREQDGGESASL